MSYIFIKNKDPENKYDRVDVTFEISEKDTVLDDLVEDFTDFLKACGYSLDRLEVIKKGES